MKNRNTALSALGIALAFMAVTVIYLNITNNNTKNRAYIVNSTIELPVPDMHNEERGYLIKSKDSKIAVYDLVDPKTPLQMTEISLDKLRVYDQELLEDGITVYGKEALCMILEDYGS